MIIIMGDTLDEERKVTDYLRSQGYYEETDLLEYHVNLVGARSQEQLDKLISERFNTVTIKKGFERTPLTYDNCLLKINWLNENYGASWFIHDVRPLWFLAEFIKLVEEVKIVAICNNEKSPLGKILISQLPSDALRLNFFDEAKISDYLAGKTPPADDSK